MRRLLPLLLSWLLVMSAFASENLLFNPGFEGSTLNGVPWSWLISANGQNKVELVDDAYSGKNAVKLTKKRGQESNYVGVGQNIFVEGGATYRLSVWAKGQIEGIEPNLFAWRYNDTTATITYFIGNSEKLMMKLTDEYQYYYVDLVMPKEAVMIQIRCEIYSPDSEGVFWVDDFEFRKIKEPPLEAPNNAAIEIIDQKVSLSWEAPSQSFVGTYNIYRSNFNGFSATEDTLIASGVKGTTFTDLEVSYPSEKSVFYQIRAVRDNDEGIPALLMLAAEGDPVSGHNLIQNGDFELDLDGDGKPDGYSGFDLKHVKLDTSNFTSANHSAFLTKDNTITWASVRTAERIYLEQGIRYRLTAKVKSEAQVGNFRLYAYMHDFDGKYFGNTPIFVVPQKTDGWITASVEFVPPANCQFVYVVYEMYGESLVGKSWLDDLQLVPIKGGQ